MAREVSATRRSQRRWAKVVLVLGYVLLILSYQAFDSSNAKDDYGAVKLQYYLLFFLAIGLTVFGNGMYARSKGYSYLLGLICLAGAIRVAPVADQGAYTWGMWITPIIIAFKRERPESVAQAAATMSAKELREWAENSRASGGFEEAEAAYREIMNRFPSTSDALDAEHELDGLSGMTRDQASAP